MKNAAPTLAKATRRFLAGAALACSAAFAPTAQAVNVDAAEAIPAPPNTHIGLLYLQTTRGDGFYVGGNKLAGDNELNTNVAILRYGYWFEAFGYTHVITPLLPFANLSAKGPVTDSLVSDPSQAKVGGWGDAILAYAWYFWNDPKAGRYAFLAGYIFAPTGTYDNKAVFNIGENRWKFAPQVSFIFPVAPKFFIEPTVDVTFYGDNDDPAGASPGVTLKQDPSYQAQVYGRWQATPAVSAFVGLSYVRTGETETGGIKNNDEGDKLSWRLGGSWFFAPKAQVLGFIGSDLSPDGDPNNFQVKENFRLNLRFLYIF